MSKFQKGDRVAIYGTNQTGGLDAGRKTGTIVSNGYCNGDIGLYNVDVDYVANGASRTFHEKQLRKLNQSVKVTGWVHRSLLHKECPCPGESYIKVKAIK